MRWVRANAKSGGRLALFALALQLYLSFGHIHPEDIYGPAHVSISKAAAVALPAAEVYLPHPADRATDPASDFCAICASAYLLGTSFVPQAPLQPLPPISQAVHHGGRAAVVFIAPRRGPFQSRAPPIA